MADDKKNIGPEVETPAETPAPEQPAPDKPESVAGDPAPAEKAESVVSESPDAVAPETPAPDKQAQQTAIPGMDGPAPASPGKVVDFAAAREGAARDKTPDQQATKPRRDRPPKEDRSLLAIRPPKIATTDAEQTAIVVRTDVRSYIRFPPTEDCNNFTIFQ